MRVFTPAIHNITGSKNTTLINTNKEIDIESG